MEKNEKKGIKIPFLNWKFNPLYELLDEYQWGEQVGKFRDKHTQSSRYAKFYKKYRLTKILSYVLSISTIAMGYFCLEQFFLDWNLPAWVAMTCAILAFLLLEIWYDNAVNDAISNHLSGQKFSAELYPWAAVFLVASGLTTFYGVQQYWEYQQTQLVERQDFERYSLDSIRTYYEGHQNFENADKIHAYYDAKILTIKQKETNYAVWNGKKVLLQYVAQEIAKIEDQRTQSLLDNGKLAQNHWQQMETDLQRYQAKNEAFNAQKRQTLTSDIQESNAIYGVIAILFELLKFLTRYKTAKFEVSTADEGIKMGLINEPHHKAPVERAALERLKINVLYREQLGRHIQNSYVVEYLDDKNDDDKNDDKKKDDADNVAD